MYLHALATANPPASLTQRECLALAREAGDALGHLDRRSRLLLSTILRGDSGIEERQFAVRNLRDLFRLDADGLHEEFRATAPTLATAALRKALASTNLQPDALVICTCTGYLCPGLSSYVAEQLQLPSDVWLQDLVGLGCGAAIPALRAVGAILAQNPQATVACVAVEVCSAAFYLDNDPGVIVSACLFGDGAAATVWRAEPGPMGLHFHDFDTYHDPASRDLLRFEQRHGKLRNLLHPSVPDLAAHAVAYLHQRTAERHGTPARIITHSGGRDVLDAIEQKLPAYDLTPARTVLRRHGNMSSPSVLFGLAEALREDQPRPGQDWWLTAFGAGFSAHSCRVSQAA